jgi:hypothetical protein
MSFLEARWCKHCQKDTHSTADCWSTHTVPEYVPAPSVDLQSVLSTPSELKKAIDELMKGPTT